MRGMSLGYFCGSKKKDNFYMFPVAMENLGCLSLFSPMLLLKRFFFFLKYGFSTQKLVLKDLISVPV